MAKINNKDVYPDDLLITMLDFLLGSDVDNFGKTVSFPVQGLADLFLAYVQLNVNDLVQNNRFRYVSADISIGGKNIDLSTIELKEIAIKESIDAYLTQNELIVLETELIVFIFRITEYGLFTTHSRKYLFPNMLGKGIYSPMSDTFLAEDLELVFIDNNFYQTTLEEIEFNINNVVFDLGDITGEDYLDYINTISNISYPLGYPLTDNNKIYYFKWINDGVTYMCYFDEENSANSYGFYGVDGDFLFVLTDLVLFYNSASSTNPTGLYIEKKEKTEIIDASTGVIDFDFVDQRAVCVFTGSVTEVQTANLDMATNYQHKKYTFINRQTIPINFKHLMAGGGGGNNHNFSFPSEADFVLQPNEMFEFLSAKTSESVLEFVGRDKIDYNDIDNLPDLSLKENIANKVTTVTGNETSNILYGSVKAIVDWVTSFFVPKTRTITINGSAQNLTSDRSWTIAGGVTLTRKTITSANLTTQDLTGFLTYVNGATSYAIASNEDVKYLVTDTGQIFQLLVNNRSVGTGQTALTSSDVLELEKDNSYHKVTHVSQINGGLFSSAYQANPVFTEGFINPSDYTYRDIITNSFVFDYKIIFNKKMTVAKFLKFSTQYTNDEIKTCNIHAITNIAHVPNGAHDATLANFPLIFNNHTGSDAVFPTPTSADTYYYQNQKSLITYPIATPTECYGVRIIGKSNFGATARYVITKFLFS